MGILADKKNKREKNNFRTLKNINISDRFLQAYNEEH